MRTFVLMAVALLLVAVGCGSKQPMYARPAQLAGHVSVDPYRVYVRGDRLYVQTMVTNHGTVPILVSRDAWALRLANGEVLARSTGVTSTHAPYAIPPGGSHKVFVDFMSSGGKLAEAADGSALVVGGVSFGADPTPHFIGEIAISRTPMEGPEWESAPLPTAPAQIQAREQAHAAPQTGAPPQTGDGRQSALESNAGGTQLCVPGRSVACAGPGGCDGFQVCAPDGSRFDGCQCAAGANP